MRILIIVIFLSGLNAVQVYFNSTVCPDKSTCEIDETCCPTPLGYGCCPLQNAVCCSDMSHCCPHNTHCNLEEQTCETKNIRKKDFPAQDPCSSANAVICDGFCCPEGNKCLNSSKKCVQPSFETFMLPMVNSKSLGLFSFENNKCPNPAYECPTSSTCCKSSETAYGCCSYPKATCCEDKKNCCPHDYTCNVAEGVCIPNAAISNGILMVRNDKISKLKPQTRSETPSEDVYQRVIDSIKGRRPFDEELVEENAIVLANAPESSNHCSNDETECHNGQGKTNCCPFKKGVCCPDGKHCCKKGYKCDTVGKRCIRENYNDDIRFYGHPNLYPLTAVQRNMAGEMVTCEDKKTKCKGMCCKNKANGFSCCRFRDGVCCGDGTHCCPKGSTCDPKRKRCMHRRNNFFQLFNIYDVHNNYYYMQPPTSQPNFGNQNDNMKYTMTKTSRRFMVPREFCQGQSCGDDQKCCHNLSNSRLECCDI